MKYFENRQLKKEIIELDKELSWEKNKSEDAASKTRTVERELKELTRKLETAEKKITNLGKVRDKLEGQLRAQTGADLLVNALRELGVIPKPEKAPDSFIEQERLMAQMQGMRGAQQYDHSLGGLQGLTGSSGPFG